MVSKPPLPTTFVNGMFARKPPSCAGLYAVARFGTIAEKSSRHCVRVIPSGPKSRSWLNSFRLFPDTRATMTPSSVKPVLL